MTTNAQDLIKGILLAIGEDPQREGLQDTPNRVVKSWKELFSGYTQNADEILSTTFDNDGPFSYDGLVLLKDIPFNSMCEHHMLPFIGVAHVAYLPNKRVVGLSKLARLVDMFSRRLQIQEQLTSQIAQTLLAKLESHGVAVVIEAHHQCMSCRGVMKSGTKMVTSSLCGPFFNDPAARAEFYSLIK